MEHKHKQNQEPLTLYVNSSNVAVGVHDFSIEIFQETKAESNFIGTILMSPQHVKAFAHVLTQNIQQYEELFGTIPEQISDEKIQKLVEQGLVQVNERK
ncbi:DUF3467 domain-containing protein [Bacillus toyonensis]|uniref:DUF3467 domain-containing protein n=1 Tax=Bacillus toyonensis TaxID=155322 RepID=UPI000BFCAFC8|nr:DUF3467 domain-containing protein [Bacillus toyonensis]PHD95929.1 hypothetical protein COF43_23120 [Bacillus toyonensis]PHE20531.1 hypothetical protein COF41_10690 [Bacillus toyonensis]